MKNPPVPPVAQVNSHAQTGGLSVKNPPNPPVVKVTSHVQEGCRGVAGGLQEGLKCNPPALKPLCPHCLVRVQEGQEGFCNPLRICGSIYIEDGSKEGTARREFPESPSNPLQPSCAHQELLNFLVHLAELDIVVRPEGDALKISAPTGRLTPDLRTRMRTLKPALLRHLTRYPCTSCGTADGFPEPRLCFWCRERQTPRTPAAGPEPMQGRA